MDELIKFDNLKRVLEEFAVEVRNKYQDNLIENNRIAYGDLLNTVECKVKSGKNSYSVVLNLQEYWWYVENGRRSGKFPPIDNILKWIEWKPILPRPIQPKPNKNGKQPKPILPTPKQLAFLIGRKIADEGTEGTKDLTSAINDVYKVFRERIYSAISQDIDKVTIKLFQY
jgi:hypothetical protein